MSNPQEEALIKIYKAMPSAEIEERLATSDLIQLARGVAQNELQQRRARGDTWGEGTVSVRTLAAEQAQRAPGFADAPMTVVALVVSCLLVLGVVWLIAPHMALIFASISLPILATLAGKAFPKVGMGIGGLAILFTIGIWVDYVMSPPKQGWEMIIIPIALFCLSVFTLAIGASFIRGARHKGSWDDLTTDLTKAQQEATDAATGR